MTSEQTQQLLKLYEANLFKYERLARLLGAYIRYWVESRLKTQPLRCLHTVESRAKTPGSIAHNLNRGRYEGGSITTLDDARLKDLAGVRAIFHLKSYVEAAVQILEPELKYVFGANAVMERVIGGRIEGKIVPQVPGYDSWHLTITVTPGTFFFDALRADDQKLVSQLRAEVQFRTVLQHAWAEVEHELKYKHELPESITRETRDLWFRRTSSLIDVTDHGLDEAKKAVQSANQQLSVATPKGDLKESSDVEDIEDRLELPSGVFHNYVYVDWQAPMERAIPKIDETLSPYDPDSEIGPKGFKDEIWSILEEQSKSTIENVTRDEVTVRLKNFIIDDGIRKFYVQPARYTDQIVTQHPEVQKLRVPKSSQTMLQLGRVGNRLKSLNESPLANTIGICAMIRTSEKKWVVAVRGRRLAVSPAEWGTSASGVLEWNEPGNWSSRNFESWIAGGMAREIAEELGLDVHGEELTYLGLMREVRRNGKPEIVFLCDLQMTSEAKIREREGVYRHFSGENDRILFVDDSQAHALVRQSNLQEIAREHGGGQLGPQLRMALALALRWLGKLR